MHLTLCWYIGGQISSRGHAFGTYLFETRKMKKEVKTKTC